jgi:hypothetical protein
MPNQRLAQSRKKNRLLKKARVTEKDPVTGIVAGAARKVLADVQQRCTEAMKALEQHDYLLVLGALAGLEDKIRYISIRLMVLREIWEIQNDK